MSCDEGDRFNNPKCFKGLPKERPGLTPLPLLVVLTCLVGLLVGVVGVEATGGAKLSRLWTLPRGVAGGLPLGTTGAWTSSVGGSGDAVSSPVRSATERGARGESRTLGVRASLCALGGTGQVTGSEQGRET